LGSELPDSGRVPFVVDEFEAPVSGASSSINSSSGAFVKLSGISRSVGADVGQIPTRNPSPSKIVGAPVGVGEASPTIRSCVIAVTVDMITALTNKRAREE
jgi:hypothetical protein